MRNFCLLLLLINILAYAYQSWIIEPDEAVPAGYIAQDYPRLAAVRNPAAARNVAGKGEKTALKELKCVKIGPISRESDAIVIANSLRDQAIGVGLSPVQGPVWVGHWVQVVGLADRTAASVARGRLVAAGLSDAYIVSGGGESKLSLGVFRSSASADSTIRQAHALGLTTRMEERYQPGTQYWIDVRLANGRELQPGDLRSDTGQILRTEAVDCTAAED